MKITHRFLEDKRELKEGKKIIEFQMEEDEAVEEEQLFHSQPVVR